MIATTTRLSAFAIFAVALGSSLSCGTKGSGGGPPGNAFVPIDPNRPGDALYAQALAHFDAGVTAQSAGIADRKSGNATAAQSDFQAAQTEFTTARGLFDQLRNDTVLCGPSPTSIRCDAAAYYGGRCSYEIGIGANELAALAGTASTSSTSFQDAVARLDAMEAAYPGSWMLDQAAYFDGRARFHLAQGATPLDTYANARAQFQTALAANASGTYAANAQYYIGRCWYEEAFKLVNAVRPAPGSPDYVAASADFHDAEIELGKVLTNYGTSSYAVNARYYLGKTFYERPYDSTVSNAQRIANLNAAIGWFDQVIAASGRFVPGSHYWRGRCHYALAFELVVAPNAPDAGQLGLALLDLKAVPPPDVYADNALYYVAKCYVHLPVVTTTDPAGAYCTVGRAGDSPPASACDAYTALKTLAATNALYAGSPYVATTQTYIQTTLPSCACTW